MKLDQSNIALLMLLIFSTVVVSTIGGIILWENKQIRVMYSNAYAKNQECREAIAKNGSLNALQYGEKVCGPVPKFEGYQYDKK
jgi:hypothetical protein